MVKLVKMPGMSTIKTLKNDGDVKAFLDKLQDDTKKQDSYKLLEMFTDITGEPAVMWGSSIIGFGQYHYKSERSRQEGDWMLTGFSPRKQNLTLYILHGFADFTDLLKDLGKCKTSVGCLYINKLSDVDLTVLEKLLKQSYQTMKKKHA